MALRQAYRGVIAVLSSWCLCFTLENGNTGLIHISEIKTGYTDNI